MSGPAGSPVLQMTGVSKTYHALRPLRIASLTITAGERVAISGVDAGAGELLVNLVTGASLPDTGEVLVFGRRTAEIADGDEWLDSLERFGLVSPRGVLLEGSTLEQNLAMPFTLSIDDMAADVRDRVRGLGRRCGIDVDRWLAVRAGDLPAELRVRAHLARALALGPELVVVEHPTMDVEPGARPRLAVDVAQACSAGRATLLVLTNDEEFARVVAPRSLTLHGATGELKPVKRGWFS